MGAMEFQSKFIRRFAAYAPEITEISDAQLPHYIIVLSVENDTLRPMTTNDRWIL